MWRTKTAQVLFYMIFPTFLILMYSLFLGSLRLCSINSHSAHSGGLVARSRHILQAEPLSFLVQRLLFDWSETRRGRGRCGKANMPPRLFRCICFSTSSPESHREAENVLVLATPRKTNKFLSSCGACVHHDSPDWITASSKWSLTRKVN